MADRAFAICDCLMRPSTSSGLLGLSRPETVGKAETPHYARFGDGLWHARNNRSIRKKAPQTATSGAALGQGDGRTPRRHGRESEFSPTLILSMHHAPRYHRQRTFGRRGDGTLASLLRCSHRRLRLIPLLLTPMIPSRFASCRE